VIPIRRPDEADVLKTTTRAYLSRQSRKAADYPANDPRISKAWANFLKTTSRQDVETALDAYARGKCAYCEAVAAKDIEHFYPKSTYPPRMFAWDNFLRGCKNCNNAKLARFPVDVAGLRLLVDPCDDEPLDYFTWDLTTGATGATPDPARQPRALATRELFSLDQEALREERRVKALIILYLLAKVVDEDPVTVGTRDRLHDELCPHRPWLGIVRQILTTPGDRERPLVNAALAKLPEIRIWAADWL
jgi:uncharacterized protein (TIGR02646 family)